MSIINRSYAKVNREDDPPAASAVSSQRGPRPSRPSQAAELARQVDAAVLPASATRVCLTDGGRERSEPYTLKNGRWTGEKTGRPVDPEKLRRAYGVGLLAILPVVVPTREPSDAGPFDPPTFADRDEWAVTSMKAAPAGSYFVQGEPRNGYAPSRRRSSFRYARQQRHDDLARILAEIRPVGPVYPSPDWDLYISRAAEIEASFADVAGLI